MGIFYYLFGGCACLFLRVILVATLFTGYAWSQTFVNPVFASQDPYVTLWQGNYYYTESAHNQIQIRKSPTLTGLKSQTPYIAWTSPWAGPDGRANVWAPEIHQIEGRWYIYYAADFQGDGRHLLYVLEGGSDPLDPYRVANTGTARGQLVESTGKWAIDPDVFYGADGNLYLTWSCTGDDVGKLPQNLCLARMSDALHVASATAQISSPTEPWEKRTGAIQEGPVGFVHDGNTYLSYSASASWTPNDYTVGILLNTGGDLLDPRTWKKHGPIFDHHGTAYGPGSVVFVPSADGTELWNVYHAYDRLDCATWACRTIRMQKVQWDAAGLPILGYPTNPGVKSRVPSGEISSLTGWGDSPLGSTAKGAWGYNSASSVDTLPGGEGSLWRTFRDNANSLSYSVSAQIQIDSGTGQFGIYAVYVNAANHAEAYLDTDNGVFMLSSTIQGKNQGQTSYPLASGFDTSVAHTLQTWRTTGGECSFYLDGTFIDRLPISPGDGQVGLFASGAGAHFRNITVSDTSFGWGDAYGDAAQGFSPGAGVASSRGYLRGSWAVFDAFTAASPAVNRTRPSSVWNTIYQGNPNFPNYTVQVDAQLLDEGSSASPPIWGLIVCHDDRNNQLTLWINPAQSTLTWNAVVAGQSTWQSVTLRPDFDATQAHRVTAVKAGAAFTFSVDGNQLGQGTYALANGTSGLVTQNAHVRFEHYSVTDQ
jgi:GH43 family beta-xylosidase